MKRKCHLVFVGAGQIGATFTFLTRSVLENNFGLTAILAERLMGTEQGASCVRDSSVDGQFRVCQELLGR